MPLSGAPALSLRRGSSVLELNEANGFTVMPGVQGFDTPPVALAETAPANFDGSIVTNVRYQPREVFVPLGLVQGTANDVRARTRALASLMNPQLGAVTLRVEHSAASSAQLVPAAASGGLATAWTANAGTTLSTNTTTFRTGPHSLSVSPTSPSGTCIASTPTADRYPVNAGDTYTAQAYARRASGSGFSDLALRFYNAAGAQLSSVQDRRNVGSSAWTAFTAVGIAPAGAVAAGLELRHFGSTSPAVLWDDITLTGSDYYREITGYASAPLGEALESGEALYWRRFGVTLRCQDPLWVGADVIAAASDPGSLTVINYGDAITWPLWSIVVDGGIDLTLTNTSTPGNPTIRTTTASSNFSLNTDPRNLYALDNSVFESRWNRITSDSILWPLYPGENVITGTNSGGGLSYASFTYRPRWLTAW